MIADGTKICGLETSLNLDNQEYRWPMLDVTWTITGRLPAISPEAFKAAAEEAWKMWMRVCGIRLHYVESPQQANILMGIQTIGPGGVLADSGLPGPGTIPSTQLRQRYDTQEAWVISQNPPQNKIDLVRVIGHEGGHALGLGHLSQGNLLAATYSSQIGTPQDGDVAAMVARYGLPAKTVPTDPPTTPPTGEYREVLAYLENAAGALFIRRNGVIRPL